MPDDNAVEGYVYWYGLTSDGKEAYDFSSFDEMCVASVFENKSFRDIFDLIEFIEIDGREPEIRISEYLSN